MEILKCCDLWFVMQLNELNGLVQWIIVYYIYVSSLWVNLWPHINHCPLDIHQFCDNDTEPHTMTCSIIPEIWIIFSFISCPNEFNKDYLIKPRNWDISLIRKGLVIIGETCVESRFNLFLVEGLYFSYAELIINTEIKRGFAIKWS